MKKNLKSAIDDIIPDVKDALNGSGLSQLNNFRIKVVHPLKIKNPNWLASYRGNSIYNSNPIIWVRKDFYKVAIDTFKVKAGASQRELHRLEEAIEEELYKTILHELVHAICDLQRRFPILGCYVNKATEELFCEDMADAIMYGTFKNKPCYLAVQACLKDFYNQ